MSDLQVWFYALVVGVKMGVILLGGVAIISLVVSFVWEAVRVYGGRAYSRVAATLRRVQRSGRV